jgi:hypothetical protein
VDAVTTNYRVRCDIPKAALYKPLASSGPRGTLEAPERFDIVIDVEGYGAGGPGRRGLRRMTIGMELQGGRYVPITLSAVGPEGGWLDIEDIRDYAYGPQLRQALAGAVRLVADSGETFSTSRPMTDPDPLWQVALVYSVALAQGEHPTKAVAHDLGLTAAAAAQRVRRARAKGFLPPTTPGKVS